MLSLQQIIQSDPRIGNILDTLGPASDRYQAYSLAKRKLTSLVGIGCSNKQLAGHAEYETVMRCVIERLGI